jgi:hypothetical protein
VATTSTDLANRIAHELGSSAVVRADYTYSVPNAGGIGTSVVDSAVFSAYAPSFHSVALGIARVNGRSEAELLADLGYLGAPVVLIQDGRDTAAFHYRAPLVPEELWRHRTDEADGWLREFLPRLEDVLQPTLPSLQARDLVLLETTSTLRTVVTALMDEVADVLSLAVSEAFRVAIGIIRHLLLDEELAQDDHLALGLANRYRGRISFANVPLESISELYESLATDADVRRSTGLFYTPAWLARRVIDRIPRKAFSAGRAFDPACGSGTFLVCYLERLLDERYLRNEPIEPSPPDLTAAVAGMDVDIVALESTRLTLDLLAQRLEWPPQPWNLELNDATAAARPAATLLGNLPFGYRTHQKSADISSAILERWLADAEGLQHVAVVLPESFVFARSAGNARKQMLTDFRVDEIIRLPETAFETSKVLTLAVMASRAQPDEIVLVRDVGPKDLDAYRMYGTTRSFSSALPSAASKDPWVISPFYSLFATAERAKAAVVGDLFDVHVGLKPYGADSNYISTSSTLPDRRLLDDAKMFLEWHPGAWESLPRLEIDPSELHRPGPIDKFPRRKLVLRSLTNRRQRGRLAAVYDNHGIWFTNRFTGVWSRAAGPPSLPALAAYLQTAFVELWFASANPSRTLRIGGLRDLPLPRLPDEWWKRASNLCAPDMLTVAPKWRAQSQEQLLPVDRAIEEWRWFDSVVLAAFGISQSDLESVESYLTEYLDVGTYPS